MGIEHAGDLPVHPTLQVILAQSPALIVVDTLEASYASQILLHDRLAFGIVIEWERATLRWDRLRELLSTTRAAESTHADVV